MSDQHELPLFLTLEEAAKALNVARSTLTQAIRTGKLPALELGETHGATRIRRSDLFPPEETARDLRWQRIRRMQAEAKALREEAQRAEIHAQHLRLQADRAAQAVETELALTDLETAERRLIAS